MNGKSMFREAGTATAMAVRGWIEPGERTHSPSREADPSPVWSSWSVWALIAVGIFLRLIQHLANRSLWFDEASLALNIIDRSYAELMAPLYHHQAAPIGFLWLTKMMVDLFGDGEMALRSVSFVTAIASLFLFADLAYRYLQGTARPMALGLIAVTFPALYYTSELKPYGSDMFAVTLVLWAGERMERRNNNGWATLAAYAVLGATITWLSNSVIFVLAGVGLAQALRRVMRRDWKALACLALVGLAWGVSFVVQYFTVLQATMGDEYLRSFWEPHFAPFPLSGPADIRWYVTHLREVFEFWFTGHAGGVALAGSLAGAYVLYRSRRPLLMGMLLSCCMVVLASMLGFYPANERLAFFLLPIPCLLTAAGFGALVDTPSRQHRTLSLLLTAGLFWHPVFRTIDRTIHTREREDVRSVIEYIGEHKEPGDMIYVLWGADSTFQYYAPRYGITKTDYMLGSAEDWYSLPKFELFSKFHAYAQDMERLEKYGRVWTVFPSVVDEFQSQRQFFLYKLDTMGERMEWVRMEGAALTLHDLSRAPTSEVPTTDSAIDIWDRSKVRPQGKE